MGFKVPPNTEPWYQSTYGVVFSNWNFSCQSMALLDNGELWCSLLRTLSTSQGGEDEYAAWVGTVSPDGAERKMGDLWARGPTGTDYALKQSDTFAPHSNFFAAGEPSDIFTDGTTIYLSQEVNTTGASNGTGPEIYSINPETLDLAWVALDGTAPLVYSGDTYEDNHDAKQANAIKFRKPTWWNGAFYWWDDVTDTNSYGEMRVTLRRWEPGAGVSTVTPSCNNPTGHSTASGWNGQINSSTGLPNSLRDDYVVVGRSTDYVAAAVHNDWMYIVGNSDENVAVDGLQTSWIRRLDMNNPDDGIETLYYGLNTYLPTSATHERDFESDFASSPNGVFYSSSYTDWYPGLGTPDLIGFVCGGGYGSAAVLGDDLIFTNHTTNSFASGFQETGQMLCAIDIPALLQVVEDNGGPIRHDRANPLFRTIANGSTNDHGYTSHNWKNRWAIWLMMDGGTPAFNHINGGSLVTNPNADGWGNKIAYLANNVDETLTFSSYVTVQGHHVKVLEPKGSTDRDFAVEFSFEGRVLKGYAPAVGIQEAEAPEEIILQ
jgi:hypothetical protein